jgi:hypothetical protein
MVTSVLLEPGPIVIASHNPGKARELGELLEPFGFETRSAAELGLAVPAETGASFEENAALKARAASAAAGLPAIADDSGLAVEALDDISAGAFIGSLLAVLVLVGGFGMLARFGIHWPWPGWVVGNIIIWLVFGVLIAVIGRAPALAKPLWWITIALAAIAAYLALNKPF